MAGSGALEAAAERLEGFVRDRLPLPGLAVGLIGPGGWRHEFAAGVSDVASGRPLAPDALLPVASIGKMLTGVALFREQEEGRLEPDAPGAPPGPGRAAAGGLDRQDADRRGPVPRAGGGPAGAGRPRPPLPALAAP